MIITILTQIYLNQNKETMHMVLAGAMMAIEGALAIEEAEVIEAITDLDRTRDEL